MQFLVSSEELSPTACRDLPLSEASSASTARPAETRDQVLVEPPRDVDVAGVRVRPSTLPGRVDITVRLDGPVPQGLCLQLLLRKLGKDAELHFDEVDNWADAASFELEQDQHELSHSCELRPDCYWSVSARFASSRELRPVSILVKLPAPDVCGASEDVASSGSIQDSSEAFSEGTRSRLEGSEDGTNESRFRSRRNSVRVVDRVRFSYRAPIAAEYAAKVLESNRREHELAPHRFTKGADGASYIVERRVDSHGPAPLLPELLDTEARERLRSGERLDTDRRVMQELKHFDEERAALEWVHLVTGNAWASAAASGQLSLREALSSGEALCDLVNAIWPGSITGIVRGSHAQAYRRVDNVAKFLAACGRLGVPARELFDTNDLLEGRGARRVVRCLLALAARLPPDYQGHRLDQVQLPPIAEPSASPRFWLASQNSEVGAATDEEQASRIVLAHLFRKIAETELNNDLL